jgi:hypothetical protein
MPVERIKDRKETTELGPVKLYREDLEEIASTVEELGPLLITCDETFAAYDPKDFAELPERPTSLSFTAATLEGQGVNVIFDAYGSRVTLTEPNTLSRGILSRIQDVCRRPGRRRRPMYKLLVLLSTIIAATSATISLIAAFQQLKGTPVVGSIYPLLITMMATATLLLVYVRWLRRRGVVGAILVNAYLVDRPPFWRRTRDDWIVQIIGGALFLVLGFFLGRITS